MRTVVLEKPGQLRCFESEPPTEAASGEVLVRVQQVGICGTDLHAFRGRQPFFSYPRILGHELGVEVVALGPNTEDSGLSKGDLCAVEPYLNCGVCSSCRRGKTNCCESLKVLGVHIDGGMREWITVPAHKLHRSSKLQAEELALVEMLCIGAHAVRRAELAADEAVAVIGAGPIGLATALFAQLAGARVRVLEASPERLAFCQRALGVEGAVKEDDGVAQLRGWFQGDLPTALFDATGNAQSMEGAFKLVANGAKLIFVGLVQADITFHDPEFHRREVTLMSSRNATGDDFAFVIAALEEGRVDIRPWISARTTPSAIVDEFAGWLDPSRGVVKAMLAF
jgi:2-desacetyl-2-hydroxyethyl bacteriochlorophyllide A dehydrogenase